MLLGLTVPGPRAAVATIGSAPRRAGSTMVRAAATARAALHRTRHVTVAGSRLHIELRDADAQDLQRLVDAVIQELSTLPGVRWVHMHDISHRLVVALDDGLDDAARERTRRDVMAVIEAVEADLGLADVGFADRPDHPADPAPLARDVLGMSADLAGVVVGSAARLMHVQAPPVEVDLVAAANVVDQVVPVRRTVESVLGRPVTALGLGFGTSILQAITAGPAAPAVDLAHRSLLLREMAHRRSAWARQEPRLFGEPPPPDAGDGIIAPAPRPAPVPDGPLERYRRRAIAASALGSAATALVTGRPDQALGVLQSGLPKAASIGREAFASSVGVMLADRGIVVFDHTVLRLLDRMDTVVVQTSLLGSGPGQVPLDLVHAAASGSQVEVVLQPQVGDADSGVPPALPDGVELAGSIDMLETVRGLQQAGRVVALAATRPDAALLAADIGLGIHRRGCAVPWGAHLLASDDPTDLLLLLMAVGEARRVVHDSIRLATGGSAIGALLSVASLPASRVAAAPSASSVAGAMALADGARRARTLSQRRLPVPADTTPWHALPVAEVLPLLETSTEGLSEAQVAQRTAAQRRTASLPRQFASAVQHELVNPLTPVLAAGAGLSAMAGSLGDALLVSGVVMSNAVVGGTQRLQADRAVSALLRQRPTKVTVIRSGTRAQVLPRHLVRGDLVVLRAGEAVPADCRIISGGALDVDESALTGESMPVTKAAHHVGEHVPVAERSCMLYDGTWVAAGEAQAVVVAVGDQTEARRAVLLAGRPPESGVEARLEQWTSRTIPLAIGGGAAVMLSGLLRGRPLRQTLGSGVSLTVAAVPEGLPLLATAAQLAAARRLARHNVLVRNPRAIEALGRVDTLCADKTGTLTEGHIELTAVSDGRTAWEIDDLDERAREVLTIAIRATPEHDDPAHLAHPTDRAVGRARARHADALSTVGTDRWALLTDLPFEPGRGFHASAGSTDAGLRVAVKGAPEAVLPRCSTWLVGGREVRLGPKRRAAIAAEIDRLAGLGRRVLAVADGDLPDDAVVIRRTGRVEALADDAVTGLRLRGLLALTDPARGSSAAAVADLEAAGVRTIMITGDHPSTARGIGVELGLLDGDADGRMMTGPEIDACDDRELAERIGVVRVFARVTPAHKVRIVRALQAQGRAVAMTGDGANDAPAIRLADVGIALGTRGTAAAQSAADLVVLDDRIETLTDAIAEGRALWGSVRDAVAMLVGGNIGEIGFTVLGSMIDGTPPLNARQLLLVNLLTDALPALAIAIRTPSRHDADGLLDEGPERSLGDSLDHAIAAQAIACTAASTATWGLARVIGLPSWARTVGLVTMVGTQLGNTMISSGRDPVVALAGLGSAAALGVTVQTPGLGTAFGCVPLGPVGWGLGLTGAAAGTALSRALVPVLDRASADEKAGEQAA